MFRLSGSSWIKLDFEADTNEEKFDGMSLGNFRMSSNGEKAIFAGQRFSGAYARVYELNLETRETVLPDDYNNITTVTSAPSMQNVPSSAPSATSWQSGICVSGSGHDINSNVYRLQVNPALPLDDFMEACFKKCGNVIGNTGCEVSLQDNLCDVHTDPIERRNNADGYVSYSDGQPVEECNGIVTLRLLFV